MTRRETACPCEACETPGHRSWGAAGRVELETSGEAGGEVVNGGPRPGREVVLGCIG